MYCAYFGFKIKPFEISANPRFLWLGEKHKEGFSALKYGVLENRGVLLLTGDVGTGKTTLLNALVEDLQPDVSVARLSDPKLSVPDFFRHVSAAFGIKEPFSSKSAFLARFEAFLQNQHNLGKRVLLIIDEAQRLSYELLEEIRSLSNLEKPSAKLLNVFLVGQEEFNELLLDDRCRALRQRITLNYHLEPLNRKEVGAYIRHRQKAAGGRQNLFSEKALDLVYKFSGGLPRLINIICDHALLTAYADNRKFVSDRIVAECARELEIRLPVRHTVPGPGTMPVAGGARRQTVAAPGSRRIPRRRWGRTTLMILFFSLLGGYCAYLLIPGSGQWLPSLTGERTPDRQADAKSAPAESQTDAEKRIFQTGRELPPEIRERLLPHVNTPASRLHELPAGVRRENNAGKTGAGSSSAEQAAGSAMFAESTNSATGESKATGMSETDPRKTVRDASKPPVPEPMVIYFQHDTYGLDSRSLEKLDRAKKRLIQNPQLEAVVVGYTDAGGEPEYNLWLSTQRAEIVTSYLTGKGVAPHRIDSRGLGAQNPIASNQTREGRSRNRRVEIRFDYGLQ